MVLAAESDVQDDLLRLARLVGQFQREHRDRSVRFAIILLVGVSDENAAAVAERAEGVSVGVDTPLLEGSQAGYSMAVRGPPGGEIS